MNISAVFGVFMNPHTEIVYIMFSTMQLLELKLDADLDTEIETDENRKILGKRRKLINQMHLEHKGTLPANN